MKQIILLEGLPCTGKSTYAKKQKLEDLVIISNDDYIFKLVSETSLSYRDVWTPEIYYNSFLYCQDIFRRSVAFGKNIIIDNTNLLRGERDFFLLDGLANANLYEKFIVRFEIDNFEKYKELLNKRNQTTDKIIPWHVIAEMMHTRNEIAIEENLEVRKIIKIV